MLRLIALAVASGLAALVVAAGAPAASSGIGSYIIVLEDAVDPAAVAREHGRKYGVDVQFVYTAALKGYAGHLDTGRLAALEADPRVRFVSEDAPVSIAAQSLPTGVDRIDGELSPTAAIDGTDQRVDVDVAVIDTGVDPTHPDLNVVGGHNCTPPATDSSEWSDVYGHGTHVAGTIGALDNDIGVVGVAPGARIWSVKVLGNGGSGFRSWIICGIDYVTAHADVIEVANMSLSGGGADDGNCGLTDGDESTSRSATPSRRA